jgi:hypothetical protein
VKNFNIYIFTISTQHGSYAILTSVFHLRKSHEITELRLLRRAWIPSLSPGRGYFAIANVELLASLAPLCVHFDHGGPIIGGYELSQVIRRVDIKNYRPEFISSREIKKRLKMVRRRMRYEGLDAEPKLGRDENDCG